MPLQRNSAPTRQPRARAGASPLGEMKRLFFTTGDTATTPSARCLPRSELRKSSSEWRPTSRLSSVLFAGSEKALAPWPGHSSAVLMVPWGRAGGKSLHRADPALSAYHPHCYSPESFLLTSSAPTALSLPGAGTRAVCSGNQSTVWHRAGSLAGCTGMNEPFAHWQTEGAHWQNGAPMKQRWLEEMAAETVRLFPLELQLYCVWFCRKTFGSESCNVLSHTGNLLRVCLWALLSAQKV